MLTPDGRLVAVLFCISPFVWHSSASIAPALPTTAICAASTVDGTGSGHVEKLWGPSGAVAAFRGVWRRSVRPSVQLDVQWRSKTVDWLARTAAAFGATSARATYAAH